MIESLTKGDALLDLLLTNAEEPPGAVRTGGNVGCSDCALVGFMILRDIGWAKRIVRTLNLRKANFQLRDQWMGSPGTALRHEELGYI